MQDIEEKKHILRAYVHFAPILEEHFSRFQHYRPKDFLISENHPLEMKILHKVEVLIHELTDLGEDDESLINCIVEFSFDSWVQIMISFPSLGNEETMRKKILQDQFQATLWESLCTTSEPLIAISNQMIAIFRAWEIMEWCDVVDISHGKEGALMMYPSFLPANDVFLDVYADNIGFDAEEDQKSLEALQIFLDDVLRG